jgi:hypothetical protein
MALTIGQANAVGVILRWLDLAETNRPATDEQLADALVLLADGAGRSLQLPHYFREERVRGIVAAATTSTSGQPARGNRS